MIADFIQIKVLSFIILFYILKRNCIIDDIVICGTSSVPLMLSNMIQDTAGVELTYHNKNCGRLPYTTTTKLPKKCGCLPFANKMFLSAILRNK
jgi:hypothetical protein